eukprot:UC4_evm1s1415
MPNSNPSPDNANCNIAGRLNDADKLLEDKNYCAAASIAEDVLKNMPPSKDLELYSRAALIKAGARMVPLMETLIEESEDNPPPTPEQFREPYDLLKLAVRLDPSCEEAQKHLENLQNFFGDLDDDQNDDASINATVEPNHPHPFD